MDTSFVIVVVVGHRSPPGQCNRHLLAAAQHRMRSGRIGGGKRSKNGKDGRTRSRETFTYRLVSAVTNLGFHKSVLYGCTSTLVLCPTLPSTWIVGSGWVGKRVFLRARTRFLWGIIETYCGTFVLLFFLGSFSIVFFLFLCCACATGSPVQSIPSRPVTLAICSTCVVAGIPLVVGRSLIVY